MANKKYLTGLKFLFLSLLLAGCGGGSSGDAPAEGPSALGEYKVCSYTSGLSSSAYSSARVSYPCNLNNGPYPATTLTGGFTNTKEQMYWLADHLTTHGYIVITMTPTNRLGTPPVWKQAHLGGIQMLRNENARSRSPIYRKVRENKLGVMGYSMGGGGALLASAELKGQIATTIALAPYLGGHSPHYPDMVSKTLVLGGSSDTTSSPSSVGYYYDSLPHNLGRGLAIYRGAGHLDWIDTGGKHNKFETLITSWLKVYLSGDTSFRTYLDGAKHAQHMGDEWFTRYDYHP